MSGVYLYCITAAGGPRPSDVRGVGGEPVTTVEHGGMALWVARASRAPGPGLETIRAHHAVVAAVMDAAGACVPVRFGQWLDSERALFERIDERADEYRALLKTFEGTLEMGVRIVAADEELAVTRPQTEGGREYMRALAREQARRKARLARGEEIAAELRRTAGSVAILERTEPLPEPGLLSVAYLLRRTDRDRFEEELTGFREQHPGLSVLVSGPWPPYSFSG